MLNQLIISIKAQPQVLLSAQYLWHGVVLIHQKTVEQPLPLLVAQAGGQVEAQVEALLGLYGLDHELDLEKTAPVLVH